jgi:hypothetical protein
MRPLFQDIRYGWRMLLKKPGFTIVAALALALGIGANSAIFSIVNAIVFKPLPFDDLDRIVAVWEKAPGPSYARNEASVANYLDWREQSNSFENLAISMLWSANLTGQINWVDASVERLALRRKRDRLGDWRRRHFADGQRLTVSLLHPGATGG